MLTLWHYTCDHAAGNVGRAGLLLPACELAKLSPSWWPGWYVWLTDHPAPDAAGLGLTRHLAKCDRTAHRYRVTDHSDVTRWQFTRGHHLGDPLLDELEGAPGADPTSWWVARFPVPVELD